MNADTAELMVIFTKLCQGVRFSINGDSLLVRRPFRLREVLTLDPLIQDLHRKVWITPFVGSHPTGERGVSCGLHACVCTCMCAPGHRLRETTCGAVLTQEAVLQVDLGLPNEVISREAIPVHDGHSEGVVYGELSGEFKHLAKGRVQTGSHIISFVVDAFLLPYGNLEVGI